MGRRRFKSLVFDQMALGVTVFTVSNLNQPVFSGFQCVKTFGGNYNTLTVLSRMIA